MQPLPMNEFVQQNLADVGVQVEYQVVEWNTLINIWRAGAKADISRGVSAINYSYFIQDPFTGFIRHLQCNLAPPNGTNWGYYCDPAMDKLFDEVRNTFDKDAQTKVLQKVHEKYVDDALFVMITHDVNPRAMSRRSRDSFRRRTGSRTSRRSPSPRRGSDSTRSPPPCGEELEVGVVQEAPPSPSGTTPTPHPSPQGGGERISRG